MISTQLWIPHLSKAAASDLPEGWDKNDPPLAEKSFQKAQDLVNRLLAETGAPARIFVSDKLRAWQTAMPSILAHRDVPVHFHTAFGQPDSGDHLPEDTRADKWGMVNYAEPST